MTIENLEEYGITKENILNIARNVSRKMLKLKEQLLDEYDIYLSKKNLSEIIGKIFERECATYLTKKTKYQVNNAQSDQDPDLTYLKNGETILKVEIKVTSTTSAWTGGEFSKRPFDYLLISWGENFKEFFIAYTHLEKKDWDSNIAKGYYGPSFKIKSLKTKKDKIIFLGSLNEKGTRLIREDIYQIKL